MLSEQQKYNFINGMKVPISHMVRQFKQSTYLQESDILQTEDLLSEAYIYLNRAISEFTGHSFTHFRAFCNKVIWNGLIDYRRSYLSVSNWPNRPLSIFEYSDRLMCHDKSTEVIGDVWYEYVLSLLSHQEQKIFRLRLEENLTWEAISRAIGNNNKGNVHRVFSKVVDRLRRDERIIERR